MSARYRELPRQLECLHLVLVLVLVLGTLRATHFSTAGFLRALLGRAPHGGHIVRSE